MITINNILCPVDFSTHSRQALDHAIVIARRYGARVTALYVMPSDVAIYSADDVRVQDAVTLIHGDSDKVVFDLQSFVSRESASDVDISITVRQGRAALEIVHEAAALQADLLVLGSHGRTGFDRLLLGSVTERVLRTAPCPVLTVPAHHPDAVPASPVLFRNILCALDFSKSSARALDYATLMAQETDATLTVLHVINKDFEPLAVHPMPEMSEERLSLADYFRWREQETRRQLEVAVPESVNTYCTVRKQIVYGKPAAAILDVADAQGCDLVVMGVQGRGTVDIALFGSTTQQVVRQALCPVLTVRA